MKQIAVQTNPELFRDIKTLVGEERRIGLRILDILQEIEKRKAYTELKYDGLFSYCVKELKYTESQAARRIQAMRAMDQLPEIRQDIESGKLNVTTVAQAQSFFSTKRKKGLEYTKSERLEIFDRIKDQSAKEVESTLALLMGEERTSKLVLNLDAGLQKKWEAVKNLSAHSTRGNPEEILRMLLQNWLDKNDPKETKPAKKSSSHKTTVTSAKKEEACQSRFIPKSLKIQIWQRDQSSCTHCSSQFALQIDHIKPYALGGSTTLDNLRLLCRSCNLHHAIKVFGADRIRTTRY